MGFWFRQCEIGYVEKVKETAEDEKCRLAKLT